MRWLHTISLSLAGAVAGFAGTWILVWLFGLATFADYVIDLAKISVLLLALELLPNGYTLFRQQRDEPFAAAFPAFYALMALALAGLACALSWAGYFESPNAFIVGYVALAVMQRYFDCQLQARGELAAYYRIPAVTNLLRAALLGAGALVLGIDRNSDADTVALVVWGSLAIGLLVSILVAALRHVELVRALGRALRPASFGQLWSHRAAYRAYYLNSVLKRAKDSMLPLLLDALLLDKALAGLVLVYAKSFEVVSGQLRVIEAAFTNLAARARLAASRSRIAWIAAFVGQPACIAVAAILLSREGLGLDALLPAVLISFGVYPYVFEILARNDALAAERPGAVTRSLIAYVAVVGAGLPTLSIVGLLQPLAVILVLLVGLCAASVSYRWTVRSSALIEERAGE